MFQPLFGVYCKSALSWNWCAGYQLGNLLFLQEFKLELTVARPPQVQRAAALSHSALNESLLSIAFVPCPALFSEMIKIGCSCTCQMAPRCAGWARCARVRIAGPSGLVFCVLLLAILAVSAVLPRGGSVQIGRRLELVVLDLSLTCILESVVEFPEERAAWCYKLL